MGKVVLLLCSIASFAGGYWLGHRDCPALPVAIPAPTAPTANTAALPIRPDASLTPGANDPATVFDELSMAELCRTGYTGTVRNVPSSLRKTVFAAYHINPADYPPRTFEMDHLCSLELGCNNSPKNLWPQAYTTSKWNAHSKDKLENRLHQMVCRGDITLRAAQVAVSTDWIAAYNQYIGE